VPENVVLQRVYIETDFGADPVFWTPLSIGSFQGVFVPAVEKTVLYDVADERGQF